MQQGGEIGPTDLGSIKSALTVAAALLEPKKTVDKCVAAGQTERALRMGLAALTDAAPVTKTTLVPPVLSLAKYHRTSGANVNDAAVALALSGVALLLDGGGLEAYREAFADVHHQLVDAKQQQEATTWTGGVDFKLPHSTANHVLSVGLRGLASMLDVDAPAPDANSGLGLCADTSLVPATDDVPTVSVSSVVGALRRYTAVGQVLATVAKCFSALHLYTQAVTSYVAASLFVPRGQAMECLNAAWECSVALGVVDGVPQFTHDTVRRERLAMMRKQRQGKFDFSRMAAGDDGARPMVPYTHAALEVRDAAEWGLGLFAKTDVHPGALLLADVPVTSMHARDVGDAALVERASALAGLCCVGALATRTDALWDGEGRRATPLDPHVMDTVLHRPQPYAPFLLDDCDVDASTAAMCPDRVAGACRKNAYVGEHYATRRYDNEVAVGLYPAVAMANHSPEPNAVRFTFGDQLFVRCVKTIKAGTQVTLNYVTCAAYLAEDSPVLAQWDIPSPGRPLDGVRALRALDDELSAQSVESVFSRALPLLEHVDDAAGRTFVVNAAIFAAMGKGGGPHEAVQRLCDMLRNGTPDLWSVELLCRMVSGGRLTNKAAVKRLQPSLSHAVRVVFGHDKLEPIAVRSLRSG